MSIIRAVQTASLLVVLLLAFVACGTSTPDQAEGDLDTQQTGWFTMGLDSSGQCLTANEVSSTYIKYDMETCRNSSDQVFRIDGSNQLINRRYQGPVEGSTNGSLFTSTMPSALRIYVGREQNGPFSRFIFPRLGNYCIENASVKECSGSSGEYWRLTNPGY